MPKRFTIDIAPFDRTIDVLLDPTKTGARNFVHSELGWSLKDATSWSEHVSRPNIRGNFLENQKSIRFVLTIKTKGYSNAYNSGIITHEAFHATVAIFASLDCRLNKGTEELFAYMQQYIVRSVWQKAFPDWCKKCHE